MASQTPSSEAAGRGALEGETSLKQSQSQGLSISLGVMGVDVCLHWAGPSVIPGPQTMAFPCRASPLKSTLRVTWVGPKLPNERDVEMLCRGARGVSLGLSEVEGANPQEDGSEMGCSQG